MLGHGLAGSEAAGDGRRAAAGDGEKRVDDPLAGNERNERFLSRFAGARSAHRPVGGELSFVGARVRIDQIDGFFNRVRPGRGDAGQRAGNAGRNQQPVQHQRAFLNFAHQGSLTDLCAG